MKLKISPANRAHAEATISDFTEYCAATRKQYDRYHYLQAFLTKHHATAKDAKSPNFEDEKAVLKSMVAREQTKLASNELSGLQILIDHSQDQSNEMLRKAFSAVNGLANDVIAAVVSEIEEQLRPTVGEADARKFAEAAEPVERLRGLVRDHFMRTDDGGSVDIWFDGVERILIFLRWYLSADLNVAKLFEALGTGHKALSLAGAKAPAS